jgi:hypothetical protein
MRLNDDEILLLNRVESLISTAHEDVREAEHSVEGIVKAAYVLGRIAELLDGQPAYVIRQAADGWNEVAMAFNRISAQHGSDFKIHRL